MSKVVRWSRWVVILLENHSRMRELMFGDSSYIVGKYKKGGGQQRCVQKGNFLHIYNGDI